MNCEKCGKENHKNSKFCRFCGTKIYSPGKWKIPLSPRALVIALGIVLILGAVAYAAPKAIGYFSVQSAIAQANKQESGAQYQQALDILTATQGKWTTSSVRNGIALLEQNEHKYIGWQNDYDMALIDMSTSSIAAASSTYNQAQTLLQGIDPSYPQYTLVKDALVEVQKDIQNALTAELTAAQQEATAAANAKKQAQAAASAAEAAAQAQEENAASAAASAASAAQEAAVTRSFVNQLITIASHFKDDCYDTLTQAMNYDNNNDTGDATAYFGSAATACDTVQTDAKNLNNNFTDLPSGYSNAAVNMEWAAYYQSELITDYLNGDTSAGTTDIGYSESYYAQVTSFLSSVSN